MSIVIHNVEYLTPNGIIPLATLPSETFSFSDNTIYPDQDGYYKYRVYSINTNNDTSYSNVAPVTGSGVHIVPNAFSPNNDGINDVFDFYTLFITSELDETNADFEISLYNRWGSRIFYSNDIAKPWDGRSNGENAAAGVYLFQIKFTDGEGIQSFVSGLVHLVR